jgi:hypothetical protein
VVPQAWDMLALVVTFRHQMAFQQLVGEDACLGEAIHALTNFNVYSSIGSDDVMEVVGNNDFVWVDVEAKVHV